MEKEKRENFRAMLGLTQLEIAGIVKVSRSLWSHYEGYRKNLPKDVGARVSEMVLYMLTPEAKALKALSKPEYQETRTKVILGKRLAENNYQLQAIAIKVAKEQEKLGRYSKSVQLIDFLNSTEERKKLADPEGLRSVAPIVISNFKESTSKLRLLQLDQELLQKEKAILEAAIGAIKE